MKLSVDRRPVPAGMRLHPDRKRYLTASDVPAAAGISAYKTALDVHLEKIGARFVGETALMRFGRLAEPTVLAYLQEDFPDWQFDRCNFFLADDEHRIGATPDCIARDPESPGIVNVQLKTMTRPRYDLLDGAEPEEYIIQTATENMLLDAHHGVVAMLVTGYEPFLEIYTVPRNAKAEAKILDIAREFWRRIEANELPAIDYSRDAETVKKLFSPDKAKPAPIDLSTDNRIYELLERREALGEMLSTGNAEYDAIKAEIITKLGGAESAVCRDWKITNKMQTRKAHSVPESTYPVLRTNRLKEQAA